MNDNVHPVPPRDEDQIVELLRRGGNVESPPPPRVWDAIATELAKDESAAAEAPRPSSGDAAPAGTGDLAAAAAAREERRGRGGRAWRLLAAAAAGAAVTWAGLEIVDRDETVNVLASGELAPLADGAPAGSAEVVEVGGHHRLRVELSEQADAGEGYLEVWLLRPDASGMITVGVLEGETAEFLLPAGVDLDDFPLVDISREQLDGDPAHGGDSIVRGDILAAGEG